MHTAPDRMACTPVRNRMNVMSSIPVSTVWAVQQDVLRVCTTQKRREYVSGQETLDEQDVELHQKKTDPKRGEGRRHLNLINLQRTRSPKPWPMGLHVQEANWESIWSFPTPQTVGATTSVWTAWRPARLDAVLASSSTLILEHVITPPMLLAVKPTIINLPRVKR